MRHKCHRSYSCCKTCYASNVRKGKWLPYEYNMCDMFRKELLNDEMTFTKWGWIYQYNSIPNNKEDRLTLHWMKKTYEYLYEN